MEIAKVEMVTGSCCPLGVGPVKCICDSAEL